MDNRSFQSGAAAAAPIAPVSPSAGYPTNGNPGTGTPASVPGDYWFHQIGEELRQVILSAGLTPNNADLTQLLQSLKRHVGVGMVALFPVSSAPYGWLKANGANISRASYADLFSVIGTSFGVGDGSTTFALPDFRGEFLRALDDGRGVDIGRVLGTSQSSAMQKHNHFLPTGSLVGGSGASIPDANWVTNQQINTQSSSGTTALTVDANGVVEGDGNSGTQGAFAAETRPRNIALLACIKY